MRLEINMHPFDAVTFGFRHRAPDKLSTDAAPPELRMHQRVENERMDAAVPC